MLEDDFMDLVTKVGAERILAIVCDNGRRFEFTTARPFSVANNIQQYGTTNYLIQIEEDVFNMVGGKPKRFMVVSGFDHIQAVVVADAGIPLEMYSPNYSIG